MRDLLKTHGAAVKLQDRLNALKLAAVGYGLDRMGKGLFTALEKTVDASKEYTRQLSLMNAAGMTQKDIAESVASAWSTSRAVVTSTAAENLKAIRELRSVLGKDRLGEAFNILPTVQRIRGVLEALTGKPQENIAFEVVKAADLRTSGLMSAQALQKNADLMGRTLMAMGGTLNVNDFLMTLKYSKNAALSYNDDFVYSYLPTLMQEVKGGGGGGMGSTSTAGTALMSLYSAIVQGIIKKSSIPLWMEMGLVKPSDIVRNATGGFQLKPGAVKDAQLFEKNPLAWAERYGPVMEAYGKAHHLDLIQVISGMFGARNAQWAMNTLIAKAPQFERDRQLIESGRTTYDTYQRLLKTNPQLAETALHAQYQNILSIIGYQILPQLVPYMVKFANILGALSQAMREHPTLVKGLVIGLGALSVALMVSGKILMTSALIKFLGLAPMLGTALSAIGTALLFVSRILFASPIGILLLAIGVAAYAIWKHWDYIGPKLKAAWEAIKNAASAFAGWIGSKLTGMWDGIRSVATRFFDWMSSKWAFLNSLLPGSSSTPTAGAQSSSSTWATALKLAAQAAVFGPLSIVPSTATLARSYAQPASQQTVVAHTQVNLDGRKIADVVTRHQAKALSAPQIGVSGFDGRASLEPAGGTGP